MIGICKCIVIRIDDRDIISATGNTLYSNNTVYIDGFNVYYGGKHLVKNNSWKWLDLRKLVSAQIPNSGPWSHSELIRVVYFTSEIKKPVESFSRQQTYIQALRVYQSVDWVEFGHFNFTKTSNLAAVGKQHKYSYVKMEEDPLPNEVWFQINDKNLVIVDHEKREEKGSDVALASHLLIDLFTDSLDAAIVVTNDVDLAYPIKFAMERIPVGVINPRGPFTAKDLLEDSSYGVGSHWWYTLQPEDFLKAQLPDEFDGMVRPAEWRL